METIEKYNIIETAFRKHLGYLMTHKEYQINIQKDNLSLPVTHQHLKIELRNQSLDRAIFFMYQPFNGGEYTVLSIKSNQFYKSIYMDSFIKFNRNLFPNIWHIISMEDSPGNTFVEKVENYFLFVKNLFLKELEQVVEGKEWIDLPTDWESLGR